jgi:hypothetical protein
MPMFFVGRELCLLRIEINHFHRGWRFVDSREVLFLLPLSGKLDPSYISLTVKILYIISAHRLSGD